MSVKKETALNALAILLLCITPVLCLYKSHHYPLFSAAFAFFVLASLLTAALSLWFCRFRFVRYLILALGITVLVRFLSGSLLGPSLAAGCLIVLLLRDKTSSVVIASTVVIILSSFIAIEKNYPHYVIDNIDEPGMQGGGPENPIIHIVFDEAAGLSTLALAGKQGQAALSKLSRVLYKHGFTTIRNAHSSSMWTRFSLGDMSNLEELVTVKGQQQSYYFEENPLFDLLGSKGYRINVFQSSYLDFCSSTRPHIRSCYEYPISSLLYFADNQQNQLNLLVPETLRTLKLLPRFQQITPRWEISESLGFHQRMPPHLGSFSQQSVQSDFVARLEQDRSSEGQYYLAHFLYPHHPYYQTGDCKIKPRFDTWSDIGPWRNSSEEHPGLRIQADERQVRYQDYFEQYECFSKVLDGLLGQVLGVYPGAIVILHGDHSSRLSTRHIDDSEPKNFRYLDQQDYGDLYSVLFAVKYPGNVPGIMDCRISLVEFAQHFFLGQVGAMGEKTRIIADRLFAGSESCVGQLPTLTSLR